MSETFNTVLYFQHRATDEQEAVQQRFSLLEQAERLGFDSVGAHTTDDARDAAVRMIMGDGEDH